MNAMGLSAAALTLFVGLSGCSAKPTSSTYVLLPSTSNPFWQEVQRGAERASEEFKDSTTVVIRAGATDTDASRQVEVMRQLIDAKQVRALVIGPASASEIVPTIALYNRANIPVVVIDSRLDANALKEASAHVDAFIGSPNEQGAAMAARYLAARIGSGAKRVLLLAGSPVHETAHARSQGFKGASPPAWSIDERTANWSRDEANKMARLMAQGQPPDAVFAANDEMALGFVAGLRGEGIDVSRMPLIVGFDATPDGRAALKEGTLCATIAQDPFELGRAGVEVAVSFINAKLTGPTERMVDLSVVEGDAPRCRAMVTAK